MWMTVKEASTQWQLAPRTIQNLCKEGKVNGAVLFNGRWAIPLESTGPTKVNTLVLVDSSPIEASPISSHFLTPSNFETILDQFPYGVNVTSLDGTMVYANRKFMEGALSSVQKDAIGAYNILDEPNIKIWGLEEHLRKAFMGEIVTTKMLKFPNKDLIGVRYGKEFAFQTLYQDLTSFPLLDDSGQLTHIVTLFIPQKKYDERSEVMEVKTYIETYWLEPLCLTQIAKHIHLSVSRMTVLFKSETGITIHDYYNDIKMGHLCELLTRPDLLVSEVFTLCGVTYNSHYESIFKKHTGLTPRAYRESKKNFE